MSQRQSASHRGLISRGFVAALAAVFAAASWWAWMGWDTAYQVDPETGAASGPYAVWQVIGCAVTLAVIGALAARVRPVWVLLPALVIPFVGSWTVSAMAADDSGLWIVGLIILTVGMTLTTLLLGAVARSVWRVLDTPGPRRS